MRFITLSGKSREKNIQKFLINWEKKSKSNFQYKVKDFLKPYWRRNICYEEMVLAGSRLSLDLVNLTKRIAIECHGIQHSQYVEFFHGHQIKFLDQCERDVKKKEWCKLNSFQLVEIYEKDIKDLTKEWFIEKYEIYL